MNDVQIYHLTYEIVFKLILRSFIELNKQSFSEETRAYAATRNSGASRGSASTFETLFSTGSTSFVSVAYYLWFPYIASFYPETNSIKSDCFFEKHTIDFLKILQADDPQLQHAASLSHSRAVADDIPIHGAHQPSGIGPAHNRHGNNTALDRCRRCNRTLRRSAHNQ